MPQASGSPDRAGRLGRPLTRSGEGGGCLRADDGGVPAGHSQLPQLLQLRLESDGYPERRVDPCILAVCPGLDMYVLICTCMYQHVPENTLIISKQGFMVLTAKLPCCLDRQIRQHLSVSSP